MKKLTLASLFVILSAQAARANICGTDYQNFNPTSSGLDFATVHSSETLQPCVINTGFFLNYAANSLTYSETLNSNVFKGQKRKDRMLGADLSFGMGLTDRWDIGFAIPAILDSSVQDDYYVSSFDESGITEIKANTKYRLHGDENGGVAAIVSLNKNLIENNPFTGRDEGITWNFELAADRSLGNNWAVGVNAGYRKRNPGRSVPGVPFIPMKDQFIYSVASSYHLASLDTKLIFEVYGSRAAESSDQDTDRSLNILEALVGVKHDVSQNLAAHLGMTRQVDSSLGGPDWRIYGGFNFAFGPVCKTPDASSIESLQPTPFVAPGASVADGSAEASANAPATTVSSEPVTYKVDVEVLFKFNSDQAEPASLAALEKFIQDKLSSGYKKIAIEGHTDSMGVDVYNVFLSQNRANAVRQHLVSKGIVQADKIEAIGLGSSQPIADNGNYQGRSKNRRVEIKIWP